jgi:hypothetical protein
MRALRGIGCFRLRDPVGNFSSRYDALCRQHLAQSAKQLFAVRFQNIHAGSSQCS